MRAGSRAARDLLFEREALERVKEVGHAGRTDKELRSGGPGYPILSRALFLNRTHSSLSLSLSVSDSHLLGGSLLDILSLVGLSAGLSGLVGVIWIIAEIYLRS